ADCACAMETLEVNRTTARAATTRFMSAPRSRDEWPILLDCPMEDTEGTEKADYTEERRNGEQNEEDSKLTRATGGRQRRPHVIVTDRRKRKPLRFQRFAFPSIRDDHCPQSGQVARAAPFVSPLLRCSV